MGHVFVQAVRVGIAGHVQPVPPPVLAVSRRSQQPVDQPLPGVGSLVGDKRFDFVRRRRQADQVKRHAADQSGLVGRRGGLAIGNFEPGQHEMVERRADPGGIANRRERRIGRRAESPMVGIARAAGRRGRGRIGGSQFHPAHEVGNLPLGKPAVLGHFQIVVRLADGPHQEAFLGLARHDRRPRVAAAEQGRARVEPQVGPLLFGAVAFLALLDQDGADAGLEEAQLVRRGLARGGRFACCQNRADQQADHASPFFFGGA